MDKYILELLERTKRTRNPVLDLSDLGLEELPKEISEYTWLNYFYCENNKITDLTPLSNLTNLTQLFCFNNQIVDLSPLSNLTNLTHLFCSDNLITDFTPLTNLHKLKHLHVCGNTIENVTSVVVLINLVNRINNHSCSYQGLKND